MKVRSNGEEKRFGDGDFVRFSSEVRQTIKEVGYRKPLRGTLT